MNQLYRSLSFIGLLLFALSVIVPLRAEEGIKLQGDCIASFSTQNIRSLANAEQDQVLQYLEKKIKTDAARKGVRFNDKEAMAIARSFDAYIGKGFQGNSSQVKTAAGTAYCRTYQKDDAWFVGVFLLKK